MEDVRLGRRIAITETFVAIDVTPKLVVDASPKRVFLIISSDQGASSWVSTNPLPGVQQGIQVPSSLNSLMLDIKTHGQLLFKKLFAQATGPMNITIIEGRLAEE